MKSRVLSATRRQRREKTSEEVQSYPKRGLGRILQVVRRVQKGKVGRGKGGLRR